MHARRRRCAISLDRPELSGSPPLGAVTEGIVAIGDTRFYAIPDYDEIAPFLVSVISDADHWMFVSTSGALTAGRSTATQAIFPYETDDRLHEAGGRTGPVTCIRVLVGDDRRAWWPFAGPKAPGIRRNLYKSLVGNQLIFQEVNRDLGVAFSYQWSNSASHGFVRSALLSLVERTDPLELEVCDGLINVLPSGINPGLYQSMRNLTNAYKRSEVLSHGLAAFTMEAQVSDRAEPVEALTASVVWSHGLPGATLTVDQAALDEFAAGRPVDPAALVTGRPGAFLLAADATLRAGSPLSWDIIADADRSQAEVVGLIRDLANPSDVRRTVASSVVAGRAALVDIVGGADGVQCTGDEVAAAHHFSNVAFNSMRGGVPVDAGHIDRDALREFLQLRNRRVTSRHEDWLAALPATLSRAEVDGSAAAEGDPQLSRLVREYLPLTFSRRHGDPSRPWNAFSVKVTDELGDPVVHFEGNWRDIFQNWEALAASYPRLLPSMVALFVNASTVDGFNPYRITSEGIDWEVPEPNNPWSNIGYWGDHQIVYLHRLLEMLERYYPGSTRDMLQAREFSYAAVPYRLVPYEELIAEPRETIRFDPDAHAAAIARAEAIGADGKLVPDHTGSVALVTLTEKLLVPALAKMGSLVSGGGIWMNTQRPEWNDANNALVGIGVSLVTASQLHGYMQYLSRTFSLDGGATEFELTGHVAEWLRQTGAALRYFDPATAAADAGVRRRLLDALGNAYSDYRAGVYESGAHVTETVSREAILGLVDSATAHLAATIRAGRRPDGLYHSYTLVRLDEAGTARLEELPAMLEGQVAVLSCGLLDPAEQVAVCDALYKSELYRPDQDSFMLYPTRRLASFVDKNVIRDAPAALESLLDELAELDRTPLVERDAAGDLRFDSSLASRGALEEALDDLANAPHWGDRISTARDDLVRLYESVFGHDAYTGRSGSMYAYEGIGSIYWHMVAKLLVALQEGILVAAAAGSDSVDALVEYYWRVRRGLGFEKSARRFGAFPTDAYSHTPAHTGAQQPGMTGQVKEEVLTRRLELGFRVEAGRICFDPTLLSRAVLANPEGTCSADWAPLDAIAGEPGAMALTVCGVPVVVELGGDEAEWRVTRSDGSVEVQLGAQLDEGASADVFNRTGRVARIRLRAPLAMLVAIDRN